MSYIIIVTSSPAQKICSDQKTVHSMSRPLPFTVQLTAVLNISYDENGFHCIIAVPNHSKKT